MDPLLYVWTATTWQLYPSSDVLKAEELQTAFQGVTINLAKQIRFVDEVGILDEGKKADSVVLDIDPHSNQSEELDQLVIVET